MQTVQDYALMLLSQEVDSLEQITGARHPCKFCQLHDCGAACTCERCCTKQQELRKYIDRLKELITNIENGEYPNVSENEASEAALDNQVRPEGEAV